MLDYPLVVFELNLSAGMVVVSFGYEKLWRLSFNSSF